MYRPEYMMVNRKALVMNINLLGVTLFIFFFYLITSVNFKNTNFRHFSEIFFIKKVWFNYLKLPITK